MKQTLILFFLILFSMTALPLTSLKNAENTDKKTVKVSATVKTAKKEKNQKENSKEKENFSLLLSDSGEIVQISAKDYVFGVLAAEMPVNYCEEALKAQAVAAYTFALRRKGVSKNGYDISDDYTKDQSYISREKAREKWGANADENEKKLNAVCDAVSGQTLTYNGQLALTVYHAVSSGKTYSCKEVWGSDLPYLTKVDSSFDKSSPNYKSVCSFSSEEINEKLKNIAENNIGDNAIDSVEKYSSGRVKSLAVAGKEVSGSEVSKALGLKSSNFEVKFENGVYIFTAYGYGHGVGMSQYGANEMAKQGSSYKEILSHYYPDTKLQT